MQFLEKHRSLFAGGQAPRVEWNIKISHARRLHTLPSCTNCDSGTWYYLVMFLLCLLVVLWLYFWIWTKCAYACANLCCLLQVGFVYWRGVFDWFITGGGVGGNSNNSSDTSGMDDILIVTSRQSEPAILWANYLKTRFDKITKQRGRQPFK